MSSIAYISDDKMIEYHRTEGNQKMNFWRLSLKKFERFEGGDLLFFIDKRYAHPKTKEKGIIGFGRAYSIRTMSVRRTWNEYETMNGYTNYDSFKESIIGLTKYNQLPKQIQSIELHDVVFFKAPIFLSEVGFDLTKRLESFVYLEDQFRDVSLEILQEGYKIGIDSWFKNVHNHELTHDSIHEAMEEQEIRNLLAKISIDWTHAQETMFSGEDRFQRVGYLGYSYHKNHEVSLYLPCSSVKNQIFTLIGINEWIKKELDGFKFVTYICIKGNTPIDEFKPMLDSMTLMLEYI